MEKVRSIFIASSASLILRVERQLVGQQEVLGDLLGDGRGALRTPPAAVLLHEQHRGARDAGEVDAAVLVEILVLGGDEGIDDKLGHGLDRNVEPPLARVFGEQRSVGGVHPRHHRAARSPGAGNIREATWNNARAIRPRRPLRQRTRSFLLRTTSPRNAASISCRSPPCADRSGRDIPAETSRQSAQHPIAADVPGHRHPRTGQFVR